MEIPEEIRDVCETLHRAGYGAYLVGGCVRDFIMGLPPKDFDVATDAVPSRVMSIFDRAIPTGIDHGTITVVSGSAHVEITTFRNDGHYSDGRRPDSVQFGVSLQEDLERRDFTCNAIAFSVRENRFIDPSDGMFHIRSRMIQTVGDPAVRFQEDALRLMRAVRFMCTKEFSLEKRTYDAICSNASLIQNVSKERVRDELMKILGSQNPAFGIQTLESTGLLEYICPVLLEGKEMHQNVKWHALPVWDHVILTLASCASTDPIVKLAVLLHDIAKPATRTPHPKFEGQFQFLGHDTAGAIMAENWMREMKFSNEEIQRVKHLIQHHLVFYESSWSDARVRRWVRKVGKESVDDLLTVYEADLRGKALPVEERLAEIAQLRQRVMSVSEQVISTNSCLKISGRDIIRLLQLKKGGPEVGRCLRWLTEKVTDDPTLNEFEVLSDLVQEFAESGDR